MVIKEKIRLLNEYWKWDMEQRLKQQGKTIEDLIPNPDKVLKLIKRRK